MRWLFLLGGLLVWAVHFLGVYAAASLAVVRGEGEARVALAVMAVLTLACLAVDALLFRRAVGLAWRAGEGAALDRFWATVAGAGALVSFVAVLWQGLPVFFF